MKEHIQPRWGCFNQFIYILYLINKIGVTMSYSFEVVELVGISYESSSDAIKSVVLQANEDKKVAWFEVIEERGRVTDDGKVEFQVKVKVGRKL
ncbi:MAG: dodecin domain-containing protein [Melioribacteraceae bacterium]|nr:dodecin domain-containing protein [Melioribacteraceae bacterium]MCF8354575.1 dodecin domain-containing protein [Melioribacteraceae bacterium]MCF8394927.1 dodecin domain-containing protein [Melioribacteraceae bacterium]MCF8420152.1 dodecin domain-containing protein [Melioribacteraceae bacterium]